MLDSLTMQIKQNISGIPGIFNLKTSIEQGAPEMDVVIDRYMASYYSLTAEGITTQIKDMLMGRNAGKFENGGELSDITVRLPELSLSEFNTIMLRSGNKEVPLSEVARIYKSVSPKQLLRINQNRIGTVTGDIDRTVAFDKVIGRVREKISSIVTPDEYEIKVTGEEEKRADAMRNLGFALLLSVVLVYMVMASQFESLIHPFTVLLTIPLAGAGSIWAFFLLGKSLNIMAYIGIIMLGGIAVNNSILLVDAINQFRAQGLPLQGSHSESRSESYPADSHDEPDFHPGPGTINAGNRTKCSASFTHGNCPDIRINRINRHVTCGHSLCLLYVRPVKEDIIH